MKRYIVMFIAVLVLGMALISSLVQSGTVTKGNISKQDLHLYYTDDSGSTFSRTTSTGYSMTLNVIDWMGIDVLQVYGNGVNATKNTLDTALADIGKNHEVELFIAPVIWTFTTDDGSMDYSDYSTVWNVAPGAMFDISPANSMTLPSPERLKANPEQQLTYNDCSLKFGSGGGVMYPEWWGADGSGDDATEINLCVAAAKPNTTIRFNKDFTIGDEITIEDKTDLVIEGTGSLTLASADSDDKCFDLVGTIDNLTIRDLELVGENNTAYSQNGIGAASGQTISNTLFDNLKITTTNVGISINADSSGSWVDAHVRNCKFTNIVGDASGKGYGLHMATGANAAACQDGRIVVDNCIFNGCQRHSIYVAHTKNVTINGGVIKNHRNVEHDGAIRAGLMINRSENVTVSGMTFQDNYGGDIMIKSDRATDSDYICKGVTVQGCVFENYLEHSLWIGYIDIANDHPLNVQILGNIWRSLASTAYQAIRHYGGQAVRIANNQIGDIGVTQTNSSVGINLVAATTPADSDTYTHDLVIENNTILTNAASGEKGINVASCYCTGSAPITFRNNRIPQSESEIYFAADLDNVNITGEEETVFINTAIAAATDETHVIHLGDAPSGCGILDVLLIDRAGVAADGTDYRIFTVTDVTGNTIGTINTSAVALTSQGARSMQAEDSFDQTHLMLAKDEECKLVITHANAGAALEDLRVVVRYVTY